jgi:hypothetical protein
MWLGEMSIPGTTWCLSFLVPWKFDDTEQCFTISGHLLQSCDFTLGMNVTVWLLVNLRNRGHHVASCGAKSLGRGSLFEMNSVPGLNGRQACMTMRGTTACSSYHLNCSLLISNTIWSARDFGFWSCDIKLAFCLSSGQSEAPTVQLWGLS